MTAYEQALRLMDGDNPNTFKVRLLLESAVADGDDRAEYALATWYIHGNHAPQNIVKGIELLEKAASKGNAEAAFDLAVCFESGKGVTKSEQRAFELYRAAARKGDREAMHEVGRMLYYGLGVPQDREAADHWLAEAEDPANEPEALTF